MLRQCFQFSPSCCRPTSRSRCQSSPPCHQTLPRSCCQVGQSGKPAALLVHGGRAPARQALARPTISPRAAHPAALTSYRCSGPAWSSTVPSPGRTVPCCAVSDGWAAALWLCNLTVQRFLPLSASATHVAPWSPERRTLARSRHETKGLCLYLRAAPYLCCPAVRKAHA